MHITFKSDGSIRFRGFNLTWTEKDFGKLGYLKSTPLWLLFEQFNHWDFTKKPKKFG